MARFSVSYIYQILDKYTAPSEKIIRSTERIKSSVERASVSFQNMGKTMSKVGAIGVAAVSLPIALLGKKFINAASDAEETRSKFATIFKDISVQAEETADNFAKNFGLAGTAARKLLGDTSDMLTGFGFTQKAALDLSRQVNELAVDLASFTNFSGGAEGASAALTKALLGERESIKSLGVAILDEDVKRKVSQLRSEGIRFATEREAKAYATLQLVIEQSGNAIGDYARTQNSFANVLRRVQGRLQDFNESFGKVLLPIATKGLVLFEKLILRFNGLSESTKKFVIIGAALGLALPPIILGLGLIALSLPAIATGFGLLFSPITLTVAAITAVVAGFIHMFNTMPKFNAFITGVVSGFVNGFSFLKNWLTGWFGWFSKAWDKVSSTFGKLTSFIGFTGPEITISNDNNLTASQASLNNTINGQIDVTASGGATVNNAEFNSTAPGNLGTNLAGAS